MNPYGTTRQQTGGNSKDMPPRAKWYDTVPFRPCRPPVPFWLLDWPLETRGGVDVLNVMQPGRSCGPNGFAYGDPGAPTLFPPGPLTAPGQSNQSAPDSGQRTWAGRIRQAGAGLRAIQFSSVYTGPAIITEMHFQTFYGAITPQGDAFQYGIVPGGGTSVFKVPRAQAPIPPGGIPMLDVTWISDGESIAGGAGLMNLPEMNNGGSGPVYTRPMMKVPWNAWSAWVLWDSAGVNAGGIEWFMSFQPATVEEGKSVLALGANQFQSNTYLGGSA